MDIEKAKGLGLVKTRTDQSKYPERNGHFNYSQRKIDLK